MVMFRCIDVMLWFILRETFLCTALQEHAKYASFHKLVFRLIVHNILQQI